MFILIVQGVVHHWEQPVLNQLGQVMEDRHPSVPQNKPAGYILLFFSSFFDEGHQLQFIVKQSLITSSKMKQDICTER